MKALYKGVAFFIFVLGPAVSISACSFAGSLKKNDENTHKTAIVLNAQQQAYIDKKRALTYGKSLEPSGNMCIDNFGFLKEAGSSAYAGFTHDYNRINKGYVFLNKNKNIMDASAKEIYTEALNMKLDVLCAHVKYSGFVLVRDKIASLNDN